MELLHFLAQMNNYTAAQDDGELKAKRYQSYSNNLSSNQTPNHDFLFTENEFVYFQMGLFDKNRYHDECMEVINSLVASELPNYLVIHEYFLTKFCFFFA